MSGGLFVARRAVPTHARPAKHPHREKVRKRWIPLLLLTALAGTVVFLLAVVAVIWLLIFGVLMPLGALVS